MRFVCRICVEYRHRWTGRYEAHLWDKSTWNQNQNKKGKQGSSSSFFFSLHLIKLLLSFAISFLLFGVSKLIFSVSYIFSWVTEFRHTSLSR